MRVLLFVPLLLAACASDPLPDAPAAPAIAPEAMVATIRAAAGDADDELAVQPLRDPMVEDLRRRAGEAERARKYQDAAAALDEALAVTPEDPAVLQERAEAAILLGDLEGAEAFAHKAWTLGAKVGPLCRRHWSAIEQVRLARGDAAGVASAKVQFEACRVAGPARY
jgi:Flp pilus assembly protein TadD